MTGEDETKDNELQPRLNVVHELGLFQGRLGFRRAIMLLEDGTQGFSNMQGVEQIRFSKGNIKETFGDVLGGPGQLDRIAVELGESPAAPANDTSVWAIGDSLA